MTISDDHIYFFIIIAVDDVDTATDIQSQNQGPLVVTASMLGLVSFILLTSAIAASIYIGYRFCKHDKKFKVTRYVSNLNYRLRILIMIMNEAPGQLKFQFMKWWMCLLKMIPVASQKTTLMSIGMPALDISF